jgi:hypothetical protein
MPSGTASLFCNRNILALKENASDVNNDISEVVQYFRSTGGDEF